MVTYSRCTKSVEGTATRSLVSADAPTIPAATPGKKYIRGAFEVCSAKVVLGGRHRVAHQPARGLKTYRRVGARLGRETVERARQGALTSAGDFVANYVLRAEALLVQADLGAAQFRKSGSGLVAVVGSSLTGTYLLPGIIAEFQHSHPGVRVTLQLGTAEQAIELLRSHRAELGFVAGAVAAPEIETEPRVRSRHRRQTSTRTAAAIA